MKHIVKKVISLSLALLLLVALLPVGVSADATEDTTASDTATNDTATDDTAAGDTTTDDTTTDSTEETPAAPEADASDTFWAKILSKFVKFFHWFTAQVNKVFALIDRV